MTYHYKDLNKGYNFTLDFIAIQGLHKKLCASKVMRVPVVMTHSPFLEGLKCESQIENSESVATLALARDQGKGVARLRAYK